jgi:pimeloyl-ACP methyl ester carboxylesterase
MNKNCGLQQHRININGITVNYLEGGISSSEPPVLFLHGWLLSARAYYSSLSSLSNLYRVIAPDLPGFGNRAIQIGLEGTKITLIFPILYSNLNITRCHLIGQFGWMNFTSMAANATSSIVSLSLIDSAGYLEGWPFPYLRNRLTTSFKFLNEIY